MLAQGCAYAVGCEEVAGFLPGVGVDSGALDDDVVIRPLGVEDVVRFFFVAAFCFEAFDASALRVVAVADGCAAGLDFYEAVVAVPVVGGGIGAVGFLREVAVGVVLVGGGAVDAVDFLGESVDVDLCPSRCH